MMDSLPPIGGHNSYTPATPSSGPVNSPSVPPNPPPLPPQSSSSSVLTGRTHPIAPPSGTPAQGNPSGPASAAGRASAQGNSSAPTSAARRAPAQGGSGARGASSGPATPPSISWLGWIISPFSEPIQPPSSHKLGLPNLVIPKKDALIPKNPGVAPITKLSCLQSLSKILESRTAVLNSLISALHNNVGATLNANKSEIANAMKQAKELSELSNFCLEEYRWATTPNPNLHDQTEKLYSDCVEKAGGLDHLEGEIFADLASKGLYNRPAPSAPVAPQKTLAEKIQDLFTKNRCFSCGLMGTSVLAALDQHWTYIITPALAGTVTAAYLDSTTSSPEFFKNVSDVATSILKSTPNVAFPLACTITATSKFNGAIGSQISSLPILGAAGLVNIIAAKKFVMPELPSPNHYAYWRAGPATGLITAALSGTIGYLFNMSAKTNLVLATAIWTTHAAASWSLYQSERHR